jgi:AcrR family transcriptional regulator
MDTVAKTSQDARSEKTKRSIAEAAGKLFTLRGYDAVSMREIAKEAGCSHTTIYLYFKDKEALLEQLAIPPLKALEELMLSIKANDQWSAVRKLKEKSREFIRFCLSHKSMVSVILGVKSIRVDVKDPEGEVNKLRNRLFVYLTEGIELISPAAAEEESLNQSRIYFFMINGMVFTYMNSEEPFEPLLDRILPILDEAVELLLAGIAQKNKLQNKEPDVEAEVEVKAGKKQDKKQDKKRKEKKSKKQVGK